MTTLKSITLAILATFLMSMANATETEKDNELFLKQVSTFKTDISSSLSYPEAAMNNLVEGVVSTSLKISKNGNVYVTGINGHPLLIKSVKSQLEKIKLSPYPLIHGEELILKINFEIE